MELRVELGSRSYDVLLERGGLLRAKDLLDLHRKVLIVTDTGVPQIYCDCLLAQCRQGYVARVPMGEDAKSFTYLQQLCQKLLEGGFTRSDCVVALGGGVVGDLAGMAAACYMRGIDFYNIPTTTLSQIDSSIGGKVAVNLDGVKNIVGAFHQPRRVLIDIDTLETLPQRHFNNGLIEALKAGLIGDKKLFELIERGNVAAHIEEILYRSLLFKKRIVEADKTEQGLRKILNFGHTIGHGIESSYGLGGLYHGECVGLGMLPMICDGQLRRRTAQILVGLGLDPNTDYDADKAFAALSSDKKAHGDMVTIVLVDHLGTARLKDVPMQTLKQMMKGGSVS